MSGDITKTAKPPVKARKHHREPYTKSPYTKPTHSEEGGKPRQKANTQSADYTVGELVRRISNASDRYGDKLLRFMERYGLHSLAEAEAEQLTEYIITEGIT